MSSLEAGYGKEVDSSWQNTICIIHQKLTPIVDDKGIIW